MAKNSRAHPLLSHVPNLQLPAILPAHLPSRTLHHPTNPLYPILLLSRPFSTPGHFSSHVFQPSHIHHEPRLWNDLPPKLPSFSLPPPLSLPITIHHLHPALLSITPRLST